MKIYDGYLKIEIPVDERLVIECEFDLEGTETVNQIDQGREEILWDYKIKSVECYLFLKTYRLKTDEWALNLSSNDTYTEFKTEIDAEFNQSEHLIEWSEQDEE